MRAQRGWPRRLLRWLKPGRPAPAATQDQIGDHLRAAIAADAQAKTANVQTYAARVDAMVGDLFAKYGDRDARHHP